MEVLAFFETVSGLWENPRPEPEEFLAAGDKLVVLGTWRARAAGGGCGAAVFSPRAAVSRAGQGRLLPLGMYYIEWRQRPLCSPLGRASLRARHSRSRRCRRRTSICLRRSYEYFARTLGKPTPSRVYAPDDREWHSAVEDTGIQEVSFTA